MNREAELRWYKAGALIFAIGSIWMGASLVKLAQELCESEQRVKEQSARITELEMNASGTVYEPRAIPLDLRNCRSENEGLLESFRQPNREI